MHSNNTKYLLVFAFLLFLTSFDALSQNNGINSNNELRERVDIADTIAVNDTLAARDSLAAADSLALLEKSSLSMPAFTSAGDSIIEVFSEGRRLVYYYGGATVTYEDMTLTADYMEYDMASGIIYARGTLDTLTGEWIGQPQMQQGESTYSMEEVRYNVETRKARITNMTTQEEEGLLHGKNIKMMPDRSINITNGRYTVCDADEPHYYLQMTAAKVITEPKQKTVFGPAYPVFEGVPLFPVVLPFGFVPPKPQRATGIMMPSFGEETARGFYMRDAGMYFVIGDFFDISLTGDVYTLGSWAIDLNSRYKVNYKFNGNLSLNYSVDQTGERGGADFFQSTNFGVKWSHSQDSKARPGTTFSASVNFSSPSNNRYNSMSVSEALQNQASSSISYSKNWDGKFNLSLNMLHNQNSRDSSYSFTLPNVTFSMTTMYPFKRKVRVGKERFYEKISIGYNTTLQNRVAFKASEFGQEDFANKFQNGMTHNFSIGLPSFSLAKYINVSPGVSYGMNWFFKKNSYEYNPETNQVEYAEGKQFGSFGITQTYSASVSASTRLYGMFNFGNKSKLQAIRHVVSPSMSLSLSPELGTAANGWRTLNYVDANGQPQTFEYNQYAGQMYSAPGKGRGANMSFAINNNFEAKVKDLQDTTGVGTKKVKLIDQLNFRGSYNFLADSLKLSNIGVTMSTSIFEKVAISANANFDPYAIDDQGRRINKLQAFQPGAKGIARLTNASASLSYSLSGEGRSRGNTGTRNDGSSSYSRVYYHPITGDYIPGGWVYYNNTEAPWSASFSYSFSYSKSYSYSNNTLKEKKNLMQTLGFNGSLRLTPKMNLSLNSGFDFMAMKMTTTSLNASYDLHCFNISVSWIPTGQWQSYSFRIAANASALADILRFKKSTSFWDNE